MEQEKETHPTRMSKSDRITAKEGVVLLLDLLTRSAVSLAPGVAAAGWLDTHTRGKVAI